jgi:hypothetical protein
VLTDAIKHKLRAFQARCLRRATGKHAYRTPEGDLRRHRTKDLLEQTGSEDIVHMVERYQLKWYGHVLRTQGAVRKSFLVDLVGNPTPGYTRSYQLRERLRAQAAQHGLDATNAEDRGQWRRASQPPAIETKARVLTHPVP